MRVPAIVSPRSVRMTPDCPLDVGVIPRIYIDIASIVPHEKSMLAAGDKRRTEEDF
jgi:hypothetical protein